ncbi:MAG TPA: hypothetical protein VD973_12780 [Symbiobacteriaceae bacterium]|nr:hypothetical protein [Symbiobacteriaceae bacterium]
MTAAPPIRSGLAGSPNDSMAPRLRPRVPIRSPVRAPARVAPARHSGRRRKASMAAAATPPKSSSNTSEIRATPNRAATMVTSTSSTWPRPK